MKVHHNLWLDSPEQKEAIREAAKKDDRSMNNWLVQAIKKALKKEGKVDEKN